MTQKSKPSPKSGEKESKDCLFQYGTRQVIFEDTDLITRTEADELWEKYLPDIQDRWNGFESPEMCIWINCKSGVDYHTQGKDIDFRDCILENGEFFRTKKEII